MSTSNEEHDSIMEWIVETDPNDTVEVNGEELEVENSRINYNEGRLGFTECGADGVRYVVGADLNEELEPIASAPTKHLARSIRNEKIRGQSPPRNVDEWVEQRAVSEERTKQILEVLEEGGWLERWQITRSIEVDDDTITKGVVDRCMNELRHAPFIEVRKEPANPFRKQYKKDQFRINDLYGDPDD